MEQEHSEACIWCSAPEDAQMNFRAYISIPAPDWESTADEDISHCMDCVKIYHRERAAGVAEKPDIEQALFPTEVKRLQCSLNECLVDLSTEHEDVFDSDSDDACNISDEDMLDNYWENSQQEACSLPVPVQEILWFPFYLQDEDVNEMFCHLMKVLHRTDQLVTVVDKPLSGLLMLLIHPDIRISNWANKSVAHLGNHAIESYEQFTHGITLMLSVISFGLFDDRTLSSICEEAPSARRILPSHLFPHQQLVYWQGLSCLLCWISEENLNQLGSELHSNIIKIYSTTLTENKFKTDDERNSFWPKLLGFQQLIDKLGFRIWQYLTEVPELVFDCIFNHPYVRIAVGHLKMKNTKLEHQPGNRVHATSPYAWIRPFVSSLLEYDSIAKHCVTMVLDKMTNEMDEALTNQMKTTSDEPIGNEEPSLYIQHSISSLVEILESLITCNFLCVSLSCFEKCLNIMVLFLTKFLQQQGSSQQFTSCQSSPLRFIRNLLKICVKKKISLTESELLIKDIDSCTNFMDVDQYVLNMCIQNLVGHLHSIGMEDTVKVYNDDGASTSTVSEDNKDYCTCTFEPFVSIKEEILDDNFSEPNPDYMFEDSSITNDEVIVISSDSEDDLPGVTGLLDDKMVVKKEFKSSIKEEISDRDFLEPSPDLNIVGSSLKNDFVDEHTVGIEDNVRGIYNDEGASTSTISKEHDKDYCCTFEPFVSIKKEIPDNNFSEPNPSKNIVEDIEHARQAPYTMQDTAPDTIPDTSCTEQNTLSYSVPDSVPNTTSDIVQDVAPKTTEDSSQDIAQYTSLYTVQDTAPDTDQEHSSYTAQDTLTYTAPDTVQDTAPDTEQANSSYTAQDTLTYTAPDTVQDTAPDTEQENSSYTAQDTLTYTAPDTVQDTVPDTEQANSSYTAQDTLTYTAPDTVQDTVPDTEQEHSSYTAQDTLTYTAPDTVQDTVPDTEQANSSYTAQDTLTYTAPDTVQDTVPDTEQANSSYTAQDTLTYTAPDTAKAKECRQKTRLTKGLQTVDMTTSAVDLTSTSKRTSISNAMPHTSPDTLQDSSPDSVRDEAPNDPPDTAQDVLPCPVKKALLYPASISVKDTTPDSIQGVAPNNATDTEQNNLPYTLHNPVHAAANTIPDTVEEITSGLPYMYTPERIRDLKNTNAEKINKLNKLIKIHQAKRVEESGVKKSLFHSSEYIECETTLSSNSYSNFDKPVPTASLTSDSDSHARTQTVTNDLTVVQREQRKVVETLNLPTNKSGTLNADPPIDEHIASDSHGNPPITNAVTQRENVFPIQAVPVPHKTLSLSDTTIVKSANTPHQQRSPKTRKTENALNRFKSRTASLAQDLEATELQTSMVSVTRQERFSSGAVKHLPSETLATCSKTTAASKETSSSSKASAVQRQCNRIITLDQLIAIMLSWDPMWLDKQDFPIDDIIKMDHYVKPDQIGGKLKKGLMEVPLTFDSIQSYINVFVPLLCLETWHYVLQEYKRNKGSKGSCVNMDNVVVSGRFLTCKRKIFSKDPEQKYPGKEDLVILSLSRSTSREKFPSYRVFAMVTKTELQQLKGKASQQTSMLEVKLQVKVPPQNEFMMYNRENKNIQIQVVTSMMSRLRLFMCFKILHQHLLSQDILCPRVRPVPQLIASPHPSKLITKLDICQSEAADKILTCMETELMIPSISLLHGPPGTGKTRTIVNIIERILKKKRPVDNTRLLPNQKNINMENRPRIIVCAPSNIAVDQLMLKVADMCLAEKDQYGNRIHNSKFNCGLYNIVRVGNSVHNRCMRYQLSAIVDNQMQQAIKGANNVEDVRMRKEIDNCQKTLDEAIIRCTSLKFNSEASLVEKGKAKDNRDCLDKQLKDLKKKRVETIVLGNKQSSEESVLKRADIIFCTLNGSGSNFLNILKTSRHPHFKYVIVDEACQCTELDTLIPLQFKGFKLLLVGDPHQLTATVLSEKAKALGFQQSLFERMCKHFRTLTLQRNPVHLLSTQYRMHPEICSFPSKHFYNNEIETDLPVATKTNYDSFRFRPYLLFDIIEDGKRSTDKDITNKAECEMVSALVSLLVAFEKLRIGIITPCEQHKILLEEKIKRLTNTNESIGQNVEISTVDGFQGHEKDVIILFCVRARGSNIGFVGDCNRMNVALTRAKMALYIVGHFKTLQKNKDWGELLRDAEQRKLVLPVRVGQYGKVAELCMKDHSSPSSTIRREPESSFEKEAKGTGKPCEEDNGQGKCQAKKARREEGVLEEGTSVQNRNEIGRSGKGYSNAGSKGHSLEPRENRDLSSSSRNIGSKDGKNAKNLSEVIKSVSSKHQHGPLLKEIPGLPPNPTGKQGRSSQIRDQQHKRQKRTGTQDRGMMQQCRSDSSSGTQAEETVQNRKRHSSLHSNPRQEHGRDVMCGIQEREPVQKRKRHSSGGDLETSPRHRNERSVNTRREHGRDVMCGIQEREPVEKRKRHSSGGDLETSPRHRNERSVSIVNKEWQDAQRDRSSTTTSTTLTEPTLQRHQPGKKRIAHKPRGQSSGPTSSGIASEGQAPKSQGNEGFQIETNRSMQSTCCSARSDRTKSILGSPSKPKSSSDRHISFSRELTQVRIFKHDKQDT